MAIRALSTELQAIAKKEVNEDPNRLEQDLKHITDWLAKQSHLKSRTEPQFLVTFLRGCKSSLERAKEKLDMFYTLRTALPEYFTNRDPMLPELQSVLTLGTFLPLPEHDDLGRTVIIMRNGINDPAKHKINDLFKVDLMIFDILLEENDQTAICGTVSVIDHSKATIAHMAQFTPTLAKKGTTLFQDGYPVRPKSMHHINLNSTFMTVYNMFQSFMKEKLRNRVNFHSNVNELHKHIPKRILPLEYGGEAGPIADLVASWKKKVEDRRSWFIENEKYKVDEKKRPGRPKTHEDLFGLEGSFRPLNVD